MSGAFLPSLEELQDIILYNLDYSGQLSSELIDDICKDIAKRIGI